MTAARTGQPEVLKLLLNGGADLDARENWFGETALIWAAAENHADAVRVLVERGADVNVALGAARRSVAGAPASRCCRSAAGRR